MTRKLISFDWAIKKILRSKANFGILEDFLSECCLPILAYQNQTWMTVVQQLENRS
jgi:hypothetical protein